MAAALPWIRSRWFDLNGKPLSGGKVWFYQAGTNVPKTSYTDSTGLVPNTNPVILDANGEADIWLIPGSYKMVLMDKDDTILFTRDKIKPNDGGGGGITDSDYMFEGYSARFQEQFGPTTGLQDTLAKILNISYVPPAVSLSASGSGTIREKGTTVNATTLTANITKKSDPIDSVEYFKNSVLEASSLSPPVNGGIDTYNWTGSFTDNTTFRVDVKDDGSTGGPSTASSSVTFTFVYPYYVGAGAPGLSASSVAALTKRNIVSTASRVEDIIATAGQVLYFAYPASYGALTKIFDVNNFDTISDWTLRTENITGLDGNAVSYRIYEFNNPVVAGTYRYTFVR